MLTKTLTKPFVNNDFTEIMLNRHSYRKFDSSVKISEAELQEMIAEATTAPSACNLQSWHFVVVTTEAGKEKAKSVFMPFNYPQLETCSAMVFVFGNTKSHEVYRQVWNKAYEDGRITAEKRDEIFNTFLPMYERASHEFLVMDATIDSSMAAMQLLLSARGHGYEANPIAGYTADKVAAAFDLDPEQYAPVMAIAIGKPAEKALTSDRYPAETLTDFI